MRYKNIFIVISITILLLIGAISIQTLEILWALLLLVPIILIGLIDIIQNKHTLRKNFPVIGHFRYMLEHVRPEIMQYFVETDAEGTPINRIFRSLIYQRAKNVNDTTPFGTKMNVYRVGYEWMDHSIFAKNADSMDLKPRVLIGGPSCTQPYNSSILNISAMSFGALSKNAIMALNKGAFEGGFAHNTGEGAISPYHLDGNGDLIWQIGTGYFGSRTKEGQFCEETFTQNATRSNVKMIEIKLSQGAKPGHGGILPAAKNTYEIAKIRHVEPFTDIHSPPAHSAFSTPAELMGFIKMLRELSGGKPIGFKLCIGKKDEFESLCDAMVETGIQPDFITIDGGEGGTGAAPVEFSNSLGMPLRDGLAFAHDSLRIRNLKKDIKLIASGKIFTGFHIARTLALGADVCNSARGFMMSLGCIQALECNTNTCPVGVATQDKSLMNGLNVNDKAKRVTNFHDRTTKSFIELLGAANISKPEDLKRNHINRRVSATKLMNYEEIYPTPIMENN